MLLIARQFPFITVDKLYLFRSLKLAKKGVIKLEKSNNNDLAIKYLGRALIAFIIGFFVYLCATIGYNTYLSFSKEKIEVRAENSNSVR
jgi:hypothetical protein|nr:MAG TPA: protein of unknown function DUF3333 [Siphoviridae sp. ctvzh6]DAS23415.1 MAG TPA: protein of unknown function (DUF3333) [Caudoviricetes sp.]